MSNNVVVNTFEFQLADYKLSCYADFLVSVIDEYNQILDAVKSYGYVDLAVYAQICRYQFFASQFKAPIRNAWKSIDSAIVFYCSEVERADTFAFPMQFEDYVSRALRLFF